MLEEQENSSEIQSTESESSVPTTRKNSNRYVSRSVREFVKWAPTGAAGIPFLSFLLQQQWAQALMVFPANVITSVWLAYSDNFVDTLGGIYAERGKQDARSLVQWMDDANAAMKWQFSGFEQKYLKRQSERSRDYYGTDDARQPEWILHVDLEDVFVPLRMQFSTGEGARKGQKNREEPEYCLEIWDVLERSRKIDSYKNVAILATGGSGKTTMLRHLNYRYGKGNVRRGVPKLVPFLLYLREWRDTIAENPTMTLPELMTLFVRKLRGWKDVKLPPRWAENLLDQGRALILFDGFDEVAEDQRPIVAQWMHRSMRAYPSSRFLLTSRESGYSAYKVHVDAEIPMTLIVKEFSKKERDEFVRKWSVAQARVRRGGKLPPEAIDKANRNSEDLIDQIDASEELKQMAVNPLLLNMLARLHYFCPGAALPQRRTELYQEICDLQLGARPAAKKIVMLLSKPQKRQQVLQGAALKMVRENMAQVKQGAMLELMREPLAALDSRSDVAVFLDQIAQVSELLYEPVPQEYAFAHLSFRNYLAAMEIDRLGLEAELIENFAEDWWRETVLLYSVLCEPDGLHRLVQRACQANLENVYLAYDCLIRYPNQEKIEKAWIDELQPLRYAKLAQLLKDGKWKDADQETYKLMIQTCGKDVGNGFSVKDLEEFPCWDLQRIDRLWVEASNGHFGFSVQKKIWEECGSPMSYNDDYEKFVEKVGWQSGGNFVRYDKLKFSPSHSPNGELPVIWRGLECVLFSRAKTCKL